MALRHRLTRRRFLGAAAGTSLAALSLPGCRGGTYSTDPKLPNILLITGDDLGWKDLGCYGNGAVATPNLDRLARQGCLFTNAFGVASSCSSARATFITGQYPHTNGVTGLTHAHPLRSLSPFHPTLPKLLRAAGFHTALEGKWHVSPYLPTSWYGYEERLSGIFAGDMWIRDSERTREFLHRSRGHRFYFEVNYMSNHRDDSGDFDFVAGFPVDAQSLRVPEYLHLPDWPEIRADLARFYSQTAHMDHMIGEVLDTLDELGLAEQTLVIFVSDNGAPFPGSKMTLYDRGIGTPLLLRWPQRIGAGRTSDQLVSTVDLVPTVLEAVGIATPEWVQGKSLLPLAEGTATGPVRKAVFAEMMYHRDYIPTRAVRTAKWKYIRNFSDAPIGLDQLADEEWAHRLCELPDQPWKEKRVPEEFYDLDEDPHEQRNLVDDPWARRFLGRLRAGLRLHMRDTKDPLRKASFERV
jgi:N-sulfoglucosamine sulfohydrolase